MNYLFALAGLLFCGDVLAQEMFGLTGDRMGGPTLTLDHQFVSGITEERFFLAAPLRKSESKQLDLFLRGQLNAVDSGLHFPDRDLDIPEKFGSAELGFVVSGNAPDGRRQGLSFSYGSAGTELFRPGDRPILSANAFRQIPASDGNSWIFLLTYSNSRSFLNNIPLPGFAYVRNTKDSTLMAGVPFVFYMWRPAPYISTTMLSPFVASSELAYRIWGPLQTFASVAWAPRAYLNVVEGSDDRLIFQRKDLNIGLKFGSRHRGNLSIAYVYAFDRRYFIGESTTKPTSDSIKIADGAGIELKLKLTF